VKTTRRDEAKARRGSQAPLRSLALVASAALTIAGCTAEDINTLDRPAEPVVLTGADLPRIPGVSPQELVAFRYNELATGWRQIPIQVDERHRVDLRTVRNDLPEHSLEAVEYSDPGTLTGPDPNPAIDANDEVVFMARDGFGKAPDDEPDPDGVQPGTGLELRLTDPLAPATGAYVYLFRQDGSLDPAAGRDYVDYDFNLLAGEYPDDYDFDGRNNVIGNPPENPAPPANPENSRVTTAYYSERFADRWITDELRITAGDATGVDILDRNRLGGFDRCVRTENTFAAGHGALVTNKDGPVRAIRDYIGANSGGFTQRRHVFYDRREDLTTFLRVHPLPFGPADLLDYTSAASGMSYRNDLMSGAVTIDGRPDNVPTGELTWELAAGAQGSLVVVHRYESDIPDFRPSSIYLDDATPDVVLCTGDGQAWATSGPAIQHGTPNTDPTPRGGGPPVYTLTSYRTHFYEPPGATAALAGRRSDEFHTELDVEISPRP
jgi:hypothetical protein